MVSYKLFVEGGGDSQALRSACRKGFTCFLTKAGLSGRLPRVVACGGRQNTYEQFCTAIKNGERAFLLVDSEDLITTPQFQPWIHVAQRPGDRWAQPQNTTDDHCHFMVVCMESWFLTDSQTLATFYGQGFNAGALPAIPNGVEGISKNRVYSILQNATRACKTKGTYGKGAHSFNILALIDPAKVCAASPWAQHFISTL